jgi:hypothetical protein
MWNGLQASPDKKPHHVKAVPKYLDVSDVAQEALRIDMEIIKRQSVGSFELSNTLGQEWKFNRQRKTAPKGGQSCIYI